MIFFLIQQTKLRNIGSFKLFAIYALKIYSQGKNDGDENNDNNSNINENNNF